MISTGNQEQIPDSVPDYAAWLAAKKYNAWDCQAESHPAVGVSPHQQNRICQNTLITQTLNGSGKFPVGATLVKETYDAAGQLAAFFVSKRVNDSEGTAGWLYYRQGIDGTVTHNAVNQAFCAGCHSGAPRDAVFSTVQPSI